MPELWNGVFLATCIASAIGTIVMAFLANKPFAMAPGMGLNSFFAVVVTNIVALTGMTYVASFQAALCIVLVEGIVFLILSVLNIREKIVDAIPLGVRLGIAPAIGLMLLNIGVGSNAGIYSENGGPFYAMRDFFGALTPSLAKTNMGSGYSAMVLSVVTMFVGLFAIVVLAQRGVKGAVLLGMLIASIIYWAGEAIFLGTNPFASLATASFVPAFGDMASTTLFKFNFQGFAQIGWFTAITLIVTFCIIDMFDTIGTLVGTASRAGMLDKDGKMPNMKQALLSDAVGTVAGSLTGTSTVTTFVESASGVEAGGRTGLTALTTGIMFLACIFIAPIAGIIPAAATSSALIYVGVLMVAGLKNVDFDDICQALPVALMMIAMPISGSIGHAIGIGLITYTVIKVFTGKAKDVSVLTYVLSLIFLLKFFIVA
jgi:AGZA family xanthine/uracil permease-like MFS transporter